MKENIPFVGLHAHSAAGSVFDGFGFPQAHMDFAYNNGMDALALTDHGNMNGLSYQILHAQKMKAEGKNFKPIFGVEAYFVPSVNEWKREYDRVREDKKAAKQLSKSASGVVAEAEGESKRAVNNILNRRRHLILLATSQTGLNNLFSMISQSFQGDHFYRYPRVDYKLLKKYNEGVIAASACLGGVYAGDFWENRDAGEDAILDAMRDTTLNMIDVFGTDRWFGELQWNNVPEQHRLNKLIIQMHQEHGIGLISTADSHYPSKDAWKDRELYKRLGWLGKSTQRPDYLSDELPVDVDEIGYELYPKNGEEMWQAYKKYSAEVGHTYDDDLIMKSITNTHRIAHEVIEDFMPDTKVRLPDFVVPEGSTSTGALTKMCVEGLKLKGLTETDYVERLKQELTVIDDRGFSKYFLTMAAVANRANETMLAGPGRGSAAGSLVAYVLGVTQVDPIKYNLLFSRFLRSDASDYPDIDYDVSDPMTLKEDLIEKWGQNNVVPISNFNTLQLRSLIKDISKFYGVSFTEVNEVTSKMLREATPAAKKKHGIKSGVYTPTFEEVMTYSASLAKFLAKYPKIKDHIEAIHGSPRSTSRHAGGVVIGEDLNKHMPLISSGGVVQTPWSEGQNVRHLEPLGFIKFDILGLSTLRMIETAVEHILKRGGNENPSFQDIKNFYDEHLHPDKIDFTNQEVYKNVFHKGRWAGIFQFTEKGAQAFCRRTKPTSIIDIAAVTSIFRPGPLGAKVDKFYVEAKNNADGIAYVNDVVREVTEETYGFLIFQEQIALLAHKLGDGVTLDEGNLLRKLLTKKGTGKGHEKKDAIYEKFIRGCTNKGLTKSQGDELWQKFEYFSGYGFNKSHAVSYSILSFQCAWLFNYYPAEWMASFLDKEPESRKEAAMNIAKKFRFKIEPVDVNTSGHVWEIGESDKVLIQPFSSVKGLGDKAIEQILNNRPFKDIEHFLFNEDVVYAKLNKKALDVLCRSGALNSLMDDRFSGMKHFWSAVACDRPKTKKKFHENIELYEPEGEFTKEETIDNITSLTGGFPMHLVIDNDVKKQLDFHKIPPVGNWDNDLGVAWFIPRQVVPKKTKNGKDYWIVHVLDDTNKITSIKCWGVNPKKDIIHLNHPYMAKLNYDEQWGFSTRSIKHTWRLLG